MTLILPDGQPFATGATAYHYRPATAQETTPRLVLEVAIDGIVTPAMVDTGGLYLVCHPSLATQLHLEPAEAISGPRTLLFRGVLVQGRLYRLTLTLLAHLLYRLCPPLHHLHLRAVARENALWENSHRAVP